MAGTIKVWNRLKGLSLADFNADKTKVYIRFRHRVKQSEMRGKSAKGGFTDWKMKAGAPWRFMSTCWARR